MTQAAATMAPITREEATELSSQELSGMLRNEENVLEVYTDIPFEYEGKQIIFPSEFEYPDNPKECSIKETYIKIERMLMRGIAFLDRSVGNPQRRIWKTKLNQDNPTLAGYIKSRNIVSRGILSDVAMAADYLAILNPEEEEQLVEFTAEGTRFVRLSEMHNRTDLRRIEISKRYGSNGDGAKGNDAVPESQQSQTPEQISRSVDLQLAKAYHTERLEDEGFEGDINDEVARLMQTGKPEYTSFIYIVAQETKNLLADFTAKTKDLKFE